MGRGWEFRRPETQHHLGAAHREAAWQGVPRLFRGLGNGLLLLPLCAPAHRFPEADVFRIDPDEEGPLFAPRGPGGRLKAGPPAVLDACVLVGQALSPATGPR